MLHKRLKKITVRLVPHVAIAAMQNLHLINNPKLVIVTNVTIFIVIIMNDYDYHYYYHYC